MCLHSMIRDLKENIGNLSDLSKSVSEIQDTADHRVPMALLYCCRSWSIHLTEGVQWPIQGTNAPSVKLADFETFSREKLMYWLEVMSLTGRLSAVRSSLMELSGFKILTSVCTLSLAFFPSAYTTKTGGRRQGD